MKATRSRLAALEVVTRVRERSAYAHETLDAVLADAGLSREDTAFATRLAYETIASRGTLDEIVSGYVSSPKRLESQVSDGLAVAAAEILFLSTAPHAAVSQGVELVRTARPAAAGMANAILRRIAEKAADFPWGDPATDDAALARLHRHPQWLAQLWIAELGRDRAAAIMAADNEPAPLYVSEFLGVPRSAETAAALSAEGALEASVLPGLWRATDPATFRASEALKNGLLLVIDAGARFASDVVPVSPNCRIIEIGAGRGTKSLLLGARANSVGGSVLAVDVHGFKLERLAAAAQRHGLPVETATADATALDPATFADHSADAVLIDAPCSGLGTLRRHPDRRWSARPDDIESVATLGSAMLERAARLVRPGGFMVYSTCTIARRENQDVIAGFLGSAAGEGFAVDSLEGEIPPAWERFRTGDGFFQSTPEPGGPDGHFVARLVRC